MARFQQHHIKATVDQSLAQSLRQRSRLEANPEDSKPEFGKLLQQRLWLACDFHLSDDPAR